jgi:hypothetical protein
VSPEAGFDRTRVGLGWTQALPSRRSRAWNLAVGEIGSGFTDDLVPRFDIMQPIKLGYT